VAEVVHIDFGLLKLVRHRAFEDILELQWLLEQTIVLLLVLRAYISTAQKAGFSGAELCYVEMRQCLWVRGGPASLAVSPKTCFVASSSTQFNDIPKSI